MNYIRMTTFSHPSEMDKEAMARYLKRPEALDNPYIENIWWFEVDAKTHGSIISYKDKASYEADFPRVLKMRDEQKDSGRKLNFEATGECFAILRE